MNPFSHFIKIFSGIPVPIWWLSFVSFINRSGAMVICFLTLYLTSELHFSLVEAGYLMSIFGLGDIAGAYLGGRWTDKYGYQRVQLLTLIGSGIFLFVLMVVKDFWSIAAILFIQNLISTAFRPANSVAIKANSDVENRTRAYSLLRVGVNLAVAFALAAGGFLIGIGWKWVFIADGVTCLAAAALVYFLIPEQNNQIQNQSSNSSSNTQILNKSNTQENHNDSSDTPILNKSNTQKNNQSPYKDKDFLLFTFATFVGAMVFMQIVWTVPAYFKTVFHWDEKMIGMVSALNGVVVMIAEMPLVFQVDGKRSNLWLVRLGIFLYALAYIALILPVEYALLSGIIYMTIISFGEIFVMPFSTTWAMKRAPEATTGQYIALYTMAYSVSNVLAPIMGTQIIAHFGFDVLWIVLCVLCVLAFMSFASLNKRQEIEKKSPPL